MSSVTPEIHEQYRSGPVADLAARRAYEQAWARFAQQPLPEDFCASWLLIQCHAIAGVSDGIVVLAKPGSTMFAPIAFYPEPPRDRMHLAPIVSVRSRRGEASSSPGAVGGSEAARDAASWPIRYDWTEKCAAWWASTSRDVPNRSSSRRCATCNGARLGSSCCCAATPIQSRRNSCASRWPWTSLPRCSSRRASTKAPRPSPPSLRRSLGATGSRSAS